MSLKRLKAIVFDFDGTLARPELSFEEMNRASIEAVAALMPEFPPKEEPALEWLEKVYVAASRLRGEGFAQEVLRQADMAMAEVEVAAVKRGGLFPETREILKKLVNSKVKTGIVTRNCRKAVLTALPDLEKLCSCLLSRDDISKWKPDPVHLRTALELMRVAPEEARIVLPLNTMTTVTWTGSLLFWSRVCNQRLDNHAQKAANELAGQIAAIAQPIFPVSWAALVGGVA